MIYCFDLDGTICTSVSKSQYEKALPDHSVIDEINRLFDEGNIIKIMTARGSVSRVDHTSITKTQLSVWGVKYHELIMHKKPHADWFIDDKGISVHDWKSKIPQIRGIVAGAFDIIHPGYIRMFKDCKRYCTNLTIALHEDPTIERPQKIKPVQTVEDRKEILESIRYVDNVIVYKKESEFLNLLSLGKYNIRFLGDDYNDGSYTGKDIDIEIMFVDRGHGYSTTNLKKKICETLK